MRFLICTVSFWQSRPKIEALPPDGRMKSSSVRMVVDLPAPLGPRKPKMSPLFTVMFTFSMPRLLP